MTTVGLLFRFEVIPGKEDDAARFLEEELPAVMGDLPGSAWLAMRFGPTSFGIVDAFPAEEGRHAHVGERLAAALRAHDADRFAAAPVVEEFDVLAMRATA
ncbi:MAG: antibiotic biosynthesis monooxygenase [Solirubrobacteraceae bacterium]